MQKTSATEPGRVRIRETVAAAVLFLALAWISIYPLGVRPSSLLPEQTDAVTNCWVIARVCHQAAHDPWHLLDGNDLYPNPLGLAYAEPLVGVAAIAWPFYALTGNDVFTFNATYVLTLALAGLTMFLLVRELTGSAVGGVLAGEIYAFTTANYDSAARLQVVSSEWAPLVLYFLVRVLRRGRLRDGIGLGLSFALQALACNYYQLYLATLLALTFPLFLLLVPRPRLRNMPWLPLLAGGVLSAALVLHLDLLQLRHLRGNVDAQREFRDFARLHEYTSVLPGNWIYGSWLGAPPVPFDHRFFPGVLPLVLGAVGLFGAGVRRLRGAPGEGAWGPALLLLGAASLVLACGLKVPTPWGEVPGPLSLLVRFVPGYGQTRVATRFIPFLRLALAVFAASGFSTLISRFSPLARNSAAVLLATLLPLEHLSVPLPTWPISSGDRIPQVYHWLGSLGEGTPVLEFPPNPQGLRQWEAYWQHFSSYHWLRTVNGTGSFYPLSYDLLYDELLELPSERGFRILQALGVSYLVFHPTVPPSDARARAVRRFERLLPRFQDRLEEVRAFQDPLPFPDPVGGLGNERVYRLRSRAEEAPAPPLPAVPYPRKGWTCESQPEGGGCERALDGDLETVFTTGFTQAEGQYVRFFFPGPLRVGRVSLRCGRYGNRYPRSPELYGLSRGRWQGLEADFDPVQFLFALLRHPNDTRVDLVLDEPASVEGLEVRLGPAAQHFNPWWLAEVEVYP